MPTPLRLGILGCAKIAGVFCHHVQSGPLPSTQVQVVAAASRDAATAAAFAATHRIPRHHGSYEALLADDEVDAVYIPLPNSLHAAWAQAAAAAGKHVLCEKPLALSRAEAVAMFEAARKHGVMLLEGYPYWFQPQTRDMLDLLHRGTIARVRHLQASFGFRLAAPQGNIRMNAELGGGALLDAGSYPASLIRLVMGEAPTSVRADAGWSAGDEASRVDMSLSATLYFADGRRAQLSCAMDEAMHRRALVVGDGGVIETEYLNHTGAATGDLFGHLPSQLRVRKGAAPTAFAEVRSAVGSGFRFEAEAFARVIADRDVDAIERAAAASIDIAATLEALGQSARRGGEVVAVATA